jgi:hypothetical protein
MQAIKGRSFRWLASIFTGRASGTGLNYGNSPLSNASLLQNESKKLNLILEYANMGRKQSRRRRLGLQAQGAPGSEGRRGGVTRRRGAPA